MNSVPPMKALFAFDAAMKHNSFAKAAFELHVTPGAIGQQIQKLEDWLGTPLFTRSIRQVRPTPAALKYWAEIQPSLLQIQQASTHLRLRHVSEVWLSMPPTLAAKWFASRMANFLTFRPDITLHLSASTALIDFERDRVDLAIRYFDGVDPSLDSTLLYRDEARLYCSPEYAAKLNLQHPDDLARATLLHTTLLPHWNHWFKRYSNLSDEQIAGIACQHCDQSILAIETARHGQGVLLSSAILTEAEVKNGSLFEPFGMRLPVSKGYYLVHDRQFSLRPSAATLKAWLIDLAAREQ
ncbi:LysR substrate-binding domain-containing protein [Pseudomonas vanderleydeniana]|uniref:LysR family transcriptional regulator n=1 Tax=Pseudomonas vanderleydeniana TaxID=2745495 RepID=A0A9E6PH24_9PSED|nr:LysR substrate-binding domain-containing protein [Pseudomonas vanderleydeniana]QXI26297.1 LysR family transcriptional regulator [Pseudomonas vanderleydeniana]